MKTKKRFPILALIMIAGLLLSACGSEGATQNRLDTNKQLMSYNKVQRMHFYTYSWERWEVQTLYDFRITKLASTWSVWVGDGTGEPIDMCASKGWGVPYSTSLTSPDQYESGTSGAVTALMEPNGLYPSQNTAATWVLCVETDGSLHPLYSEPNLIVYDHPVVVAFDQRRGMYRIVRAGDPNTDYQIVPPTNVDVRILEEAPAVP